MIYYVISRPRLETSIPPLAPPRPRPPDLISQTPLHPPSPHLFLFSIDAPRYACRSSFQLKIWLLKKIYQPRRIVFHRFAYRCVLDTFITPPTGFRLGNNFWIHLTRSRFEENCRERNEEFFETRRWEWFFEGLSWVREGGGMIVNEEREARSKERRNQQIRGGKHLIRRTSLSLSLSLSLSTTKFSRQGKWRAFSNFRLWIWRGS